MREKAAFEAMPDGVPVDRDLADRHARAARGAPRHAARRHCCAARDAKPVVLTDIRGNWAAPWIQAVTRAGVIEAFPNHTFQPNATVRRGDLAQAVSRVLALIGARPTPSWP